MTIGLIFAPANFIELLGDISGLKFVNGTLGKLSVIHIFSKSRSNLAKEAKKTMSHIMEGGFVWISWPKQAAKVATDLNENVIRDIILPLGFVDVKVCAIDAIWSGLKLVRRKADK